MVDPIVRELKDSTLFKKAVDELKAENFTKTFKTMGTMVAPAGMDSILTTGYSTAGIGAALYVYDSTIDVAKVATKPYTMFMTKNGRGFKLAESIVDICMFGAVGDDTGEQSTAIQAAFDSGAGSIFIPAGTYRITKALLLRSNIEVYGDGAESVIHLVNNTRSDAIRAIGTQSVPLTSIRLRNFSILGDAVFTAGGTPSQINGGGFNGVFVNDCHVSGMWVSGFADGGIAFLNGNYNRVDTSYVRFTGQGISHNANVFDVVGNSVVGCTVEGTGTYNGIHLEGSFGDNTGDGRVIGSVITGNNVTDTREAGINVENAPSTTVAGNVVRKSGYAGTFINMGIKLFGSYTSTVSGNTITESNGFAIICGANSSNCTISGNTTAANYKSLLVTDSAREGGGPIQVTNDVMVSGNNFSEGDIKTEGGVSLRLSNPTAGVPFTNKEVASNVILDWYEEGVFTPNASGRTTEGTRNYTEAVGRFTRVGNVVTYSLMVGWNTHTGTGQVMIGGLPYKPKGDVRYTATAILNGVPVSGTLAASISQGEVVISLFKIASDTGVQSEVNIAGNVPGLTITGTYLV